MSLHERIKEARQNCGLTQEQLGKLIGVAKTTITGYEKNREPTAAKVGEIADALGVDVNYLFQDEVKAMHDNQATPEEMETLVKPYRSLDPYGKKTIDIVMNREITRSTQLQNATNRIVRLEQAASHQNTIPLARDPAPDYLAVNAAHARTDLSDSEITPELAQLEEAIMDDENF